MSSVNVYTGTEPFIRVTEIWKIQKISYFCKLKKKQVFFF